jgi:hypothetical protein
MGRYRLLSSQGAAAQSPAGFLPLSAVRSASAEDPVTIHHVRFREDFFLTFTLNLNNR